MRSLDSSASTSGKTTSCWSRKFSRKRRLLRASMQKSSWSNTARPNSSTADSGCTGASGGQIERIFAAEDMLEALDDRQLLQQCLAFDNNHRLEHQLVVEDGRWVVRAEHLYATEGVPFAGNVDMYVANLLAGCDGKRTLGEVVLKATERMQANREEFTRACLAAIRKLMQAGFLTPADSSCLSAR